MRTPREKYENDPQYRALVDTLMALIDRGQYTPSELREAVVFAATRWEALFRRPTFTMPEDVQA